MASYLENKIKFNNPDTISACDELPLWSAPFGLMLLETLELKREIQALDIGCGTGFPVLEICQRLGDSSVLYGIDSCPESIKRCEFKMQAMGIKNAVLIAGSFFKASLKERSFDLIVSNNGINNMDDQDLAYQRCYGLMKDGSQFVFTFNLPDTMKEFYDIFAEVLQNRRKIGQLEKLHNHIHEKRKSITETKNSVKSAGFSINEIKEGLFYIDYLDGTSMLNHFFIKYAFLGPWLDIISGLDAEACFYEIRAELDQKAREKGFLRLSIPYACFDCRKL